MQVVSAITKKVINRLFVGLGLVQATLAHELRRPTRLGSPAGRLGAPRWCRDLGGAENTQGPLLCIFIAYSSEVSLSLIAYLQALRDAGFEIIVINNKSTSVPLLQELSSICWRVYDRVNIGRDLGAYKDGIMLLSDEGFLRDCQALCIANDSVQFVPGDHGAAFTRSIIEFLKCPAKALFSHDSHQITRHYQSFFRSLRMRSSTLMPFDGSGLNTGRFPIEVTASVMVR